MFTGQKINIQKILGLISEGLLSTLSKDIKVDYCAKVLYGKRIFNLLLYGILTTFGYSPRTYVHCSESPTDFLGKPVLTEFIAHAAEIIRDEAGQWFMSSADFPHRGINVAPLVWD